MVYLYFFSDSERMCLFVEHIEVTFLYVTGPRPGLMQVSWDFARMYAGYKPPSGGEDAALPLLDCVSAVVISRDLAPIDDIGSEASMRVRCLLSFGCNLLIFNRQLRYRVPGGGLIRVCLEFWGCLHRHIVRTG